MNAHVICWPSLLMLTACNPGIGAPIETNEPSTSGAATYGSATSGDRCSPGDYGIAASDDAGFDCMFLHCLSGELAPVAYCAGECYDEGPKTISCSDEIVSVGEPDRVRLSDFGLPFDVVLGSDFDEAEGLTDVGSSGSITVATAARDMELTGSCLVSECGAVAFSIAIDDTLVLPPTYIWIDGSLACVELQASGEPYEEPSLVSLLDARFGEGASPTYTDALRAPVYLERVWRAAGVRVYYPTGALREDRKALICNRTGADTLHPDLARGARYDIGE